MSSNKNCHQSNLNFCTLFKGFLLIDNHSANNAHYTGYKNKFNVCIHLPIYSLSPPKKNIYYWTFRTNSFQNFELIKMWFKIIKHELIKSMIS